MDEMLTRIFRCIGSKRGAQKELAEYLGIHPNVITNWKNGSNKSYRGYVNEIAKYSGVSIDYLLTGEQKEKSPAASSEGDIGFDDFTYAMHNESKSLTKADKDVLLSLARQLKAARDAKNGESD